MSFNSDREYITQFFIDNLTGVDLRFEGYDYKNQEPPFIGIIINPLSRDNETLDNLNKGTDGVIRARVFTLDGSGTKEILDLCDQVSSMADNKTFNNIVTYAVSAPKEINVEGAYLAKEISIPYYSDS